MSYLAFPPVIPPVINASSVSVSNVLDIQGSVAGNGSSDINAWKGSVRVATTENITLSGTQIVDGQTLVDGDVVLVKDQTDASENGIYQVRQGSWTRLETMEEGTNASGAGVFVTQGSTFSDSIFVCTNIKGSDTVGTNDLVFTQASGGGGTPVTPPTGFNVLANFGETPLDLGNNEVITTYTSDTPYNFNDDGNFDTATGVYTVPADGVYTFNASSVVSSFDGGNIFYGLFFSINDSTASGPTNVFTIGFANTEVNISALFNGSCTLALTSGDTVRIKMTCTTTASVIYCRLSGHSIRFNTP